MATIFVLSFLMLKCEALVRPVPTSALVDMMRSTPNAFVAPQISLQTIHGEERGLVSHHSSSPADTLLISIPPSSFITAKNGESSPTGKLIGGKGAFASLGLSETLTDSIFISIWLCDMLSGAIEHTADDEVPRQFVADLPLDMSHCPKMWNEEDISFLKGSKLVAEISESNDQDRAAYDIIAPPNSDSPFSFSLFQYSQAVTHSRLFGFGGTKVGLVPLCDMLNHALLSETRKVCDWGIDEDSGAFTITSGPHLPPEDEELCISYGLHSNRHMLQHYGFVSCREARIADQKKSEPEEAFVDSTFMHIGGGDKIMEALDVCREAEAGKWSEPILSEEAAIRAFRNKVHASQDEYPPDSDAQDSEGLEMALGSRRQQAAVVRTGEKRVLLHLERICSVALLCLQDVRKGIIPMSEYNDLLRVTCFTPKLLSAPCVP